MYIYIYVNIPVPWIFSWVAKEWCCDVARRQHRFRSHQSRCKCLALDSIGQGFERGSSISSNSSGGVPKIWEDSKNFPTYPWNIPQTPNQRFMKEFLSFGGLGIPGVCSKGMLGFS